MKLIQAGAKPTLYVVLPCILTIRKVLTFFDNLLDHVKKYLSEEETNSKLQNVVDHDDSSCHEKDEGN